MSDLQVDLIVAVRVVVRRADNDLIPDCRCGHFSILSEGDRLLDDVPEGRRLRNSRCSCARTGVIDEVCQRFRAARVADGDIVASFSESLSGSTPGAT